MVAASEGIADKGVPASPTSLTTKVEKEPMAMSNWAAARWPTFLTKASVKQSLGYKRVRGDTFGYLQRSFAGCVSDADQREARRRAKRPFSSRW